VLGIKGPEDKAAEALPPAPQPVAARKWADSAIVHVESLSHLDELKAKAKAAGAGVPIVLDFTATWCGPCRMIAPHFEALSKEHDACFCKVDVDQADDVAAHFVVRSMPTFVFLGPDGAELVRFSGCNKAKLTELVERTCARVGGSNKKED